MLDCSFDAISPYDLKNIFEPINSSDYKQILLETCNTVVMPRYKTTYRIESHMRHIVCRSFTVSHYDRLDTI